MTDEPYGASIIGLTGPNAAGKGEIAVMLDELGFRIHSLSDIVRAEARARGLLPERDPMIRIGNELRAVGGPGVLARRLAPSLGRRDVVDSIRNPSEVEVLRELPGFRLLGVTADPEVRFARARARGRSGDAKDFDAFLAQEQREQGADPNAQQLDACLALADEVVRNDGTLAELRRAAAEVLATWGVVPSQPA